MARVQCKTKMICKKMRYYIFYLQFQQKLYNIFIRGIMKKENVIFDHRYMGSIAFDHVSKVYGENNEIIALNNVSTQLFMGEVVVILGPSGSGKSTLLNLLGGIDRVSGGAINISGVDITDISEKLLCQFRKEIVGYVFQSYNLLQNLTSLENVELAELAGGMKAIDALKLVGMEDKQYSFPNELSGGERQRVAIARAIVKNPKILLCDEPTGALDSKTGKQIISQILKINENKDKLIIIVTHNTALSEIADRVLKLSDGKIVSDITQKKPKKIEDIEL